MDVLQMYTVIYYALHFLFRQIRHQSIFLDTMAVVMSSLKVWVRFYVTIKRENRS